ncbi:MAG: malto-oligosyltrehalose synthase, partial [bacterium]|nr:malto-oligosyltrehalose synthase [bacterium]
IDHIDGLLDPADYCRRLREHASEHGYAPYLIVEKILTGDEQLPTIWGVHGTTGYDFMNAVNALFVNARARLRFDRIYRDFAGADEPYEQIVYRAKHDVLRTQLRASLDRVARSFLQLSPCSGYALDTIREALAETIASVPVYRTYATASACSSEDRRTIAAAIALARERSTNADDSIFTAIEEILTISHESFAHAAMTFAQLTPAVAAKGIEDTAFYRFVRLLSLNEVGGDPRRFGSTIDAFHRFNERRAAEHPLGMLATATHDQKRGEDARMRINALSEMPARWRRALRSLRLLDATPASGSVAESPSANDRYALLQTLLATWPAEWTAIPEAESLDAYLRRIERWLIKAVREAKLRTSWIDPDPAYESASVAYLRGLFEPERVGAFAALFLPLACDVASIGMVSSLAQTVLKLTSIGVPDVYQGCELWDLSLVDPDNRNPVDFTVRMRALDEMCNALERGTQQELVGSLLREWRDGRIKLYVLRQLLQMRRQRPDIVHRTYRRLGCGGEPRGRLVAFARGDLLVVLPRLVAPLVHLRADAPHLDIAGAYVNLPRDLPRRYRNVLTGEFVTAREASHGRHITASDLFRTLPVAVLEGCES